MANRTYRVLGKCYANTSSINLSVSFNGAVVFDGTVPATAGVAPSKNNEDLIELCSFTADTSIVGSIPMVLIPTGGVCFFGELEANYSGYEVSWFGVDATSRVVEVAPEDYYENLALPPPAVDKKTNVRIDGYDVTTTINLDTPDTPTNTTGWQYRISAGSTLTCDYDIDPAQIVLEVPLESPTGTYPYPPKLPK